MRDEISKAGHVSIMHECRCFRVEFLLQEKIQFLVWTLISRRKIYIWRTIHIHYRIINKLCYELKWNNFQCKWRGKYTKAIKFWLCIERLEKRMLWKIVWMRFKTVGHVLILTFRKSIEQLFISEMLPSCCLNTLIKRG